MYTKIACFAVAKQAILFIFFDGVKLKNFFTLS